MDKYQLIKEATVNFQDPVTKDSRITLIGHSFSLHNAGDSIISVDGRWTIKPGSTFQLAVPQDNMVFFTKVQIKFTGGTTKRLEIAEVQLKGCEYSNYTKQ